MRDKLPPRKWTGNKKPVPQRKPTHSGPLGRAKIITEEQFEAALEKTAEVSMYILRDRLFLLLSHYAGLRAKEIASLWYEDVSDVTGKLIPFINVSKRGAKYGKERRLDMHPRVLSAIEEYCKLAGIEEGPIFWTKNGTPMTSNGVQKQIAMIYRACGYKGARSHSGRRGFITDFARTAGDFGCSIEDVRIAAGHAHLSTTQTYIDPSPNMGRFITAR